MSQEPRKATDVLVELESKIDVLNGTIQSMDLNIKILSNKLNEIMKGLDKQQAAPPRILVEAVQTAPSAPNHSVFGQSPVTDPERAVVIRSDSKLPEMESPGFRRTSRPESYAGDGAYLKREGVPAPHSTPLGPGNKLPKPPPGRSAGDVVTNQLPPKNKAASPPPVVATAQQQLPPKTMTEQDTHGIVPVEQRVVDRNGKSVFLADVEVVNQHSGEQVSKSRTNGTGKWMAALPLGMYTVTIRKLESVTREKIESVQTIQVDGTESPLKLQMVIIK
jgi:hypothetical protein